MTYNRFNSYGFAFGHADRNEFWNSLNFQNADRHHDGRADPIELRLFVDRNQIDNSRCLASDLFLHVFFLIL
jgi:hypothetical protein